MLQIINDNIIYRDLLKQWYYIDTERYNTHKYVNSFEYKSMQEEKNKKCHYFDNDETCHITDIEICKKCEDYF